MTESRGEHRVVYYGHPALRKKAKPVETITDEVRAIGEWMLAYVKHPDSRAIGLACPQIDVDLRMFVTYIDALSEDGDIIQSEPKLYINPKLSDPSEEMDIVDEACLSLPGVAVAVPRPVSITIEAMDLEGNIFTERLSDFAARNRMHENDHLNGVLTIDRTSKRERERVKDQLRKIKKNYV